MMSENEGVPSNYDRESALKKLVERVRYDDPIEEALTDMLHTQTLKQKENAAVSALTSSAEKGETAASLIAQSDLTAVKTLQIQEGMKIEEKRLDKKYVKAEDLIKGVLGEQTNNADELRTVVTEVHKRDPGTRFL